MAVGAFLGVDEVWVSGSNIGAQINTSTILGFPCYTYSLMGTKTQFNY